MSRARAIAILWLAACLVGCMEPPAPGDTFELQGRVTAGPTCPVEREPPDPACQDRPVPGAEIAVLDEGGREVARARSDEGGAFRVELVAGRYRLVPQPVIGLLGTAPPLEVLLRPGQETPPVEIVYDTGIR